MFKTLLLVALLAGRHPIHSSSAMLTLPEGTGQATVVLRVFAEDFPPGTSRPAAERYLADRFRLIDARGSAVPLRLESIAADGAVLILSLRTAAEDGLRGGKVWHGLLAEKYPDQVNLVRVQRGARSASLLFVPGDGAKSLP